MSLFEINLTGNARTAEALRADLFPTRNSERAVEPKQARRPRPRYNYTRRRSLSSRSARNNLSRDLYGTPLLFARTFKSSIMETGSRKEMVRNEGFSFGSLRRWADCQSMNSVESCPTQNSRSSSSDRNSGTEILFVLSFISLKSPRQALPAALP